MLHNLTISCVSAYSNYYNIIIFICYSSTVSCCPAIPLSLAVVVIVTNSKDSVALLLEAERQGLMNGEYAFFLIQHIAAGSGSVVSKTHFVTCFIKI